MVSRPGASRARAARRAARRGGARRSTSKCSSMSGISPRQASLSTFSSSARVASSMSRPVGVEASRGPGPGRWRCRPRRRVPSRRSKTHLRTRLFSPNPGHRNEPSSPLRNQLTQKSLGQLVLVGGLADVEPVLHVVAGVVAHERQHGEGVEADLADGAGRGRGLLRAHDRAEEGAVLPVEGLGDQRDVGGPAAAEEDGRDRHALRVLPLGGDRRALRRRGGEAGVGVGGRGRRLRGPVVALPVDRGGRGRRR